MSEREVAAAVPPAAAEGEAAAAAVEEWSGVEGRGFVFVRGVNEFPQTTKQRANKQAALSFGLFPAFVCANSLDLMMMVMCALSRGLMARMYALTRHAWSPHAHAHVHAERGLAKGAGEGLRV